MNEMRVREPGRSLTNATWICKNITKMPLMPYSQIIYFNKPNLKILTWNYSKNMQIKPIVMSRN